MIFTSFAYLLFVLIVFLVFIALPVRFRWFVLLAASYIFYASFKVSALPILLLTVTLIVYVAGLLIHRSVNPNSKKFWLWAGIASNIVLLISMKYVPFFVENINSLFDLLAIETIRPVKTIVVLGVSYYVFQGISYLIDIYLETLEPEQHLGYFALYMGFFPKLLQGPIERGGGLLPQIRALSTVSWKDVALGLQLFMWGMFKKVVIADRLAAFVDPVYSNVHQYNGLPLVIATYLFALQLYFDFSGYTDMALGVARCFDLRLTRNFNTPYLATSIAVFWRRWHISFSSWIMDYIFKPLQLQFRNWSRWGTPLALILTFLASGIWHGASWNYIVWGGIHAIYLSSSALLSKSKRKFYKSIGLEKTRLHSFGQIFVTFHLVCFAWIFFRAENVRDALYVSANAISGLSRSMKLLSTKDNAFSSQILLGRPVEECVGLSLAILLVILTGIVSRRFLSNNPSSEDLAWLNVLPFWMQGSVYGCVVYLMLFCGASSQSFIYQQF